MKSPRRKRLKPPPGIEDEALLEWGRIVSELSKEGPLAEADRAQLQLYVESWAIKEACKRCVELRGPILERPTGIPARNPAVDQQLAATKQANVILGRLREAIRARAKQDSMVDSPLVF